MKNWSDRCVWSTLWRRCRDDGASQIVEVAVSLPLLVVFVVGIFDFSGAISLKQKLANAVREGARAAAAGPANDLGAPGSLGIPVSVGDAFQVVDDYLISAKIDDCGMNGVKPRLVRPLTWQSSSVGGCPGFGVTLTIDRGSFANGCTTQQSLGGGPTQYVVNSCVTIQYPHQWEFSRVIGLLVPSSTWAGVSYMTTTATALNEN